jgi:tRNA modification GTPase
VARYKSHTVHFGRICDGNGSHVDDVLLLPFLGGKSFTGEDTVEIHCHGGSLITRRVLDVVLHAGARAALPGEFSFKAFINGKIDLAQAEAIQQLICAKNERAVDAAGCQLQGALSLKIATFQHELTRIAAILEAWVDFPEEGLEFASMEELCEQLSAIKLEMAQLVSTFHDGRIVHDGVSLCLIGAPNVGKSSLMNALLDKERAIVSHIPGTTRDIVEDSLRLNGLNLRLIDTAGLRDAADLIEQEGIRRSRLAMADADLILLLLDASRELNVDEVALLSGLPPHKAIVVWNKSDLLPIGSTPRELPRSFPHIVTISAKDKTNIGKLHQEIDRVIWQHGPPSREELLITNVRHKEALIATCEACQRVVDGLTSGASPEFLAFDMREARTEIGKIIGSDITEDLLTAVFSQFCIGK